MRRLIVAHFVVSRSLTAALLMITTAPGVATAQQLPDTVRPLPTPTGPNAVGTAVAYLVDRGRTDPDFPSGRPINLQLWYPSSQTTGTRAPYLFDERLGAAVRRTQYYGIDRSALATWDTLRTHAIADAPVKSDRYPLVTFSVGLGVIRANYTSIASELASHGYVVALVESPYAGFMVRPGGVEVAETTGRLETAPYHRASIQKWAGDVSFALDELRSDRASAAMRRVATSIDWSRVGAAGHSSGGLVAVAACEADARVRACINIDGGLATPTREPLADFATTGVTKPTLFLRSQPIYSDADLARRGLTRESWEKRGESGRVAFDTLAAHSRGPLWTAFVAGTGHFSFSDAPYVMPSAITRFGGKIIEADRGLSVITTVIRTFFDTQLGPQPMPSADLGLRIPEVTISRAKP